MQVLRQEFLLNQGNARFLRELEIPAHRGMIRDRNGEPLAISTPVDSVWADPGELLLAGREEIAQLARLLQLDTERLLTDLQGRRDREFAYLRRRITPHLGQKVIDLGLPGVALQREYKRFYPAGEVTGHVIGFTNIDGHGLEAIELAFNDWLSGQAGAKRVIRDRLGRVIEGVELLREAKPGHDLTLSIDLGLQYFAYRALKIAVQRHDAVGGSLVVLDARDGEVLAMVNQPGFNPNVRAELIAAHYRNRAVTDAFEPGSTLKPFAVAAALASGRYTPQTAVDTRPGILRVGGHVIHDVDNHGILSVAGVLKRSSNVGISKIALSLDRGRLWSLLAGAGFGQRTGSGFPSEVGGYLSPMPPDSGIERATLAFGAGIAVTPLQLARGYSAIANGGVLVPVSFLHRAEPPQGRRIMSAAVARQVRLMLEGVVTVDGTGTKAMLAGYRVAGKTGTMRKVVAGGYTREQHVGWFAGMVPVETPRFICVVVINEPRDGVYYGGQIAAPVFRDTMAAAVRLYNVPPDAVPGHPSAGLIAARGGKP
ncbi:MAG: penicillin-binding protein 2 [Nitrococcus sp.]|nr:penicillin-binding protein 2 [Nitrococcus sp.]